MGPNEYEVEESLSIAAPRLLWGLDIPFPIDFTTRIIIPLLLSMAYSMLCVPSCLYFTQNGKSDLVLSI